MKFGTVLLSLLLLTGIAGMACAQEVATLPALGGDTGYFSLNSIPSGADVVFDGAFQGETPAVVEVSTTGTPQHTIRMTLDGYEPWQSTYTGNPAAGETIPITATLVAIPPTTMPGSDKGYFSFNSVPSGADVVFDGTFQGETPVVVEVAVSGNPQHTIQMNLGGYEPWSSTYTGNPAAGETIPITATLIPLAQTGSIHVTSSPSGATVVLDDSRTAYTPYTFSDVPVGSHTITVHMSGYQQFYTSVNVQKGVTAQVSATLTPTVTVGSLSVSTRPSGASVYVDNIYRGISTTVVGNLQAGTHTVLLVKAGYKNWQQNVNVQAGTTTYLNIDLDSDPAPTVATVSIQSNPTGADVYGDGVYIGRTRSDGPLVFTEVKPGTHTLLLTKSGYQDYTATSTVVAGKNYDLTINLKAVPNPTTGSIAITSSPTGAEVYVNNLFRGYSPVTVDGLTPGMYTVLLKLNGYQDWQSSTTVTAGQTAQISATLLPAAVTTAAPTQSPGPMPVLVVLTLAGVALLARKFSH